MKVKVNLYGTLSQNVSGYRQSQGIEVEVPDGTTVKGLLSLLHTQVSVPQDAIVAIDGRIRKANEIIPSGARAQVFQPVHGG